MDSSQSTENIQDTQLEINMRHSMDEKSSSRQIEQSRMSNPMQNFEYYRLAQLIRQYDIHYQRSHGVILSSVCNICLDIKPSTFFTQICENHHRFCHNCTNGMLLNAIQEFKIVKCPAQGCETQIDIHSPQFEKLSKENKEKYSKIIKNKKVLQNPKLRLCSKPDCEGHYLTDATKLQCSICKQQYCPRCRQFIHSDPCDKLIARKMERKFGFRKCPQCHMVVARSQGCDHMTCLCAHQFCYKCGQSFVYGRHTCKRPPYLKGIAALRWDIQRKPSALQTSGIFNLSRILYHLEPTADHSVIYRISYILLFSILLYPILSILSILSAIISATLYCSLAIAAISGYFLILPIMEVYNLQLKPARYLRNRGVPMILIRVLVLPLYPINFIYGIKDKSDFISCEGQIPRAKSLLKIVFFFLALPFLMATASE